jgi:hypothetical protein
MISPAGAPPRTLPLRPPLVPQLEAPLGVAALDVVLTEVGHRHPRKGGRALVLLVR